MEWLREEPELKDLHKEFVHLLDGKGDSLIIGVLVFWEPIIDIFKNASFQMKSRIKFGVLERFYSESHRQMFH